VQLHRALENHDFKPFASAQFQVTARPKASFLRYLPRSSLSQQKMIMKAIYYQDDMFGKSDC
jgi:hypothetical protein